MKNTGTDYFTALRSDFTPRRKDQYDHFRRPFNPGDPDDFLFTPAPQQNTDETNTKSAFRNNNASKVDLLNQLPDITTS